MRFRASITNVETFYNVAQVIEKFQKKCIIKFTETNVHFICTGDANEGGTQLWSQIKIDTIFSSYRIQSNSNNEISLTLTTSALLSALRSALNSSTPTHTGAPTGIDDVVVKLAKKNDQAVLSFEIAGASKVGRRVRVAHDVRIDVMKPVDSARLKEPLCPEPDIQFVLPPLVKIRTIVERMRSMAPIVAINARCENSGVANSNERNGVLILGIRTDSVSVDTTWRGLVVPPLAKESNQPSQVSAKSSTTNNTTTTTTNTSTSHNDSEFKDPDEKQGGEATVAVPIRCMLRFLNSHVVSTTTIACICHKYCVVLYVYIGDAADAGGLLTFYIPAVIEGDDW